MPKPQAILIWFLTITICAGFDETITETTWIATNDVSLDGKSVLVDGAIVTVDGLHRFSRLHLVDGAVLTHTAGRTDGMDLRITDDLYIGSSASVDVSGRGYAGGGARQNGAGPAGGLYAIGGSGGGGYGGDGGVGAEQVGAPVPGGLAYGSIHGPLFPGSGGGGSYNAGVPAGNGGGLVRLEVGGTATLDGCIAADGQAGPLDIWSPCGSGAGGGVWIFADTIAGEGTISACGADGHYGVGERLGGGGAGGRVVLLTSSLTFATSGVSVAAGTVGNPEAGPGTMFVSTNLPPSLPNAPSIVGVQLPPATNLVTAPTFTISGGRDSQSAIWLNGVNLVPLGSGDWSAALRLDGDAMTVACHATDLVGRFSPTNEILFARDPAYEFITGDTHIAVGDGTYDNTALVIDGATLTLDGEHVFASLQLTNGAVLTHSSAVTGVVLSVAGHLAIASDSRIDVRGLGYAGGAGGNDYGNGYGPGGGLAQWYVGGGGSHGGLGGTCSDGVGGGPSYGSETYPATPGSGGGGTRKNGGGMPGGGTVWIKADGGITQDGVIDASGMDYEYGLYHGGGGGAGGSVLICAPTLSGSGHVDASGGDAHTFGDYGAGGGGGRVALYAALDGFALTNVSVAGGVYGNPPATAGTIHHYAGIPPAVVGSLSLSGYVTQTVASLSITFLTSLDVGSITADDITVTGPQACAVSGVASPDGVTVVADLAPALAADGAYHVSVGPHIASFAGGAMDTDGDGTFGEDPDDVASFTFTIDRTPPSSPVITNFLAAPDINIVNTSLPFVQGLKDADSTIRSESQQVVSAGSSAWTNRAPIDAGLTAVSFVARDPAGNDSEPATLSFLCDMLEPRVLTTTPTNGAVVTTPPAITVLCTDSASGLNLPGSILQVSCDGASVAGHWTFNSTDLASFTPASPLADGTYEITAIIRDRAGMTAEPHVTTFELVTPAPAYEDLLPGWWITRGLVDIAQGNTNDFAALNVGQLKWAAHGAADAFETHLPFGEGNAINALVDGFVNTQNYHAANVGQLKSVTTPFYDRLGLALPWEGGPDTNDWALANVGQLKQLFDLPLADDEDDDGLPDWWEDEHFGSNTLCDANGDHDGDGLTNLEEFESRAQPDSVDSDLDSVSDLLEVLYGSDPADASSFPVDVSGTISYAGTATGMTHVTAATTGDAWTGQMCELTSLPSAYVISNAVSGRATWIKAFLDVNRNATCDAWEPLGVTPGAPHSLIQTASGLDIVLENPDLDGDGMDDTWEMIRFGSTLPTPAGDADGDGVTNIDEYTQGTDPLASDMDVSGILGEAQVVAGEASLTIFTPTE